jgi:hypothetical protein
MDGRARKLWMRGMSGRKALRERIRRSSMGICMYS